MKTIETHQVKVFTANQKTAKNMLLLPHTSVLLTICTQCRWNRDILKTLYPNRAIIPLRYKSTTATATLWYILAAGYIKNIGQQKIPIQTGPIRITRQFWRTPRSWPPVGLAFAWSKSCRVTSFASAALQAIAILK